MVVWLVSSTKSVKVVVTTFVVWPFTVLISVLMDLLVPLWQRIGERWGILYIFITLK